jgi:hypothetical protein
MNYKDFWNPIMTGLAYTLVLCLLLDIVLVYVMKDRSKAFKNVYVELHRRYGFIRLNLLKVVLVMFIADTIHGARVGAVVLLIPAYCVMVIKLLISFIREKDRPRNREESDPTGRW